MTITQADVAAWEAEKRGWAFHDFFDAPTPYMAFTVPPLKVITQHPVINLDTDTGLVDAVGLARAEVVPVRNSTIPGMWAVPGLGHFFSWREAARAAVEAVIEQWLKERG